MKKQECWSSPNLLLVKCTLYSEFSITTVKFLIFLSFTLTVGSFRCVMVKGKIRFFNVKSRLQAIVLICSR